MAILDKYKNYPEVVFKKKLLPVPSNQKVNAYLKEIATVCEINKELSSHSARHTFATTITLTNGVPIETLSKMLEGVRRTDEVGCPCHPKGACRRGCLLFLSRETIIFYQMRI